MPIDVQRIEAQQLEITELRKTIRKLLAKNEEEESETDSEHSSDDGGDADGLEEPLWDDLERIVRCTSCGWEIVESLCQGCYTEFQWDEVPVLNLLSLSYFEHPILGTPRLRRPARNVDFL